MELGETINSSLTGSDRIAEVIANTRQAGFDVFLITETIIEITENNDPDKCRLEFKRHNR